MSVQLKSTKYKDWLKKIILLINTCGKRPLLNIQDRMIIGTVTGNGIGSS